MNNIINPGYKTTAIVDYPYPIWIFDNFLQEKLIDQILQNWLPADNDKWHNEYQNIDGETNKVEHGMKSISNFELMPDIIKNILLYFHSTEFTEFLGNILNFKNLIADNSYRWSGMRTMLPNSYQLIHSDATQHPYNRLTKQLTCLLYLNKNYIRDNHEGCLEIWNDNMQSKAFDIRPLANRFVVFVNSDTSYHGVPVVKFERKMLTFSVMSNQTNTGRTKALFVPRPFDNEDIRLQGIKRSQL